MIGEIEKIIPTMRQALVCFVNSRSATPLDCHENRDLACSCAIASRSMVVLLKRMGYKNATIAYGVFDEYNQFKKKKPMVDNINHAWVEIGDIIIDITSSQFSDRKGNRYPDTIITSTDDRRYIKFGNANDRTLVPFSEWPYQQIPRKKYINKIIRNFEDLSTVI